MNAFTAIDAGLDQINHAEYVGDAASQDPQKVIAELKRHRTVIDPTLALYELLARPLNQPIDAFEPGIRKVARELEAPLNGFGSPVDTAARQRARLDDSLALVGRLHRAGIPIVAGTDQSVPGHSLHREIELYVQAGLSPFDALVSGDDRARACDEEDRRQRNHRKGQARRSDRPRRQPARRRPRHTPQIHRVVTNGRVFDPASAVAECRLPALRP